MLSLASFASLAVKGFGGCAWLCALLFCAFQQPTGAQEWGLDSLMQELASVQHSKAHFVERKYLKMLDRPLELSGTLEYRAPDPACNPYLAFSVILAAGLDGIRRGLEPPQPAVTNVAHITPAERAAMGIKTLPTSLEEALEYMQESALVREALGDHVFESFIRNKTIEWENFRTQVTDYELKRYLPIL